MRTLLPILVLLSALSMTGCMKDPPELGYNVFADENVELFKVEKVVFGVVTQQFKDVRVTFSSVYNDLAPNHKVRLKKIRIFQDGVGNDGIPPDRTDFVKQEQKVGTTMCFEFAFVLEDNSYSRKSAPYCLTVE